MADKVKLSKDGSSIDFVQSESIPTSVKKFRQSPEIEGFYRFIYENDLQKEAFEILERIVLARKAKKQKDKSDAHPSKKADATKKETSPVKIHDSNKKMADTAALVKSGNKSPAQKPQGKKILVDPKKKLIAKKK